MRAILWVGLFFYYSLWGAAVQNDLPPRLQWCANGGYCGEVSLISSGLYFGQYLSQYTARAIALKSAPQTSGELLLGVNDEYAAEQMRLIAREWDTVQEQNTDDFLVWVKQQVVRGNPIAIGVYMNQSIFHPGSSDKGDADYDHIVTVFEIDSNHPLDDAQYYPDDILHFSDHGLYKEDGEHRPYLFQATFGAIQKSRDEANLLSSPIYSLSNDASNYGLSVSGIADLEGETLPVRVKTSVGTELPAIVGEDPPAAAPLALTITVFGLKPGVLYNLYRYNNMDLVPVSDFNAHSENAAESWVIQGEGAYTLLQTIQSNEIAVYRAVKAR